VDSAGAGDSDEADGEGVLGLGLSSGRGGSAAEAFTLTRAGVQGVVTTTSDFAPRLRTDPIRASLFPHRPELKPGRVLIPSGTERKTTTEAARAPSAATPVTARWFQRCNRCVHQTAAAPTPCPACALYVPSSETAELPILSSRRSTRVAWL